jgi:hypothetical protein
MRMSAANAKAIPPPAAAPFTAAITGTRIPRSVDNARAPRSCRSSMASASSPASFPASARS